MAGGIATGCRWRGPFVLVWWLPADVDSCFDSVAPMAIIVDGYNLLHAAGWLPEVPGPGSFERARRAVVNFVAESAGDELARGVTIVFDATDAPPGLPVESTVRGIVVRFARGYENADALIEELIAADSAPKRLTVVSSDHRIQRAARRRRAVAVDSGVWFETAWRARSDGSGREEVPRSAKPQGKLSARDVEAWLAEFGLEDELELPADGASGSGGGAGEGEEPFPPDYCDERYE